MMEPSFVTSDGAVFAPRGAKVPVTATSSGAQSLGGAVVQQPQVEVSVGREQTPALESIPAVRPEPKDSPLCESTLLSQLVQLLGPRPRRTLLLSDLGALLPGHLRQGVKEKGGLRSWLQKWPELFHVFGQPGKETVTLMLGGLDASLQAPQAPRETANTNEPDETSAVISEDKKREQAEDNDSAVQLRGLPYRSTIADVKAFLGRHVQFLKDPASVHLVLNRDGRASGFARVQFCSPDHAKVAREELHMRVMEGSCAVSGQDRYVEVFLFSERPNKLRFRKTTSGEDVVNVAREEEDLSEVAGISQKQVMAECREHMQTPGKGQLLLSMLGVALSPSSRLYLKKTDQGLKHFLLQYPEDFRVDGVKGREFITYLGSAVGPVDAVGQEPPAPRSPKARPQGFEPVGETPKGLEGSPQHCPWNKTPSYWGTPMQSGLGSKSGNGRAAAVLHQQGEAGPEPRAVLLPGAVPSNDAAAAAASSLSARGEADGAPFNWCEHWSSLAPLLWPMEAWGPGGPSDVGPPHAWQPTEEQVADPMAALFAEILRPPPVPEVDRAMVMNPSWIQEPFQSQRLQEVHGGVQPQEAPRTVILRLRGLPFDASVQDVLTFFAKHDVVDVVAEGPDAVKMVTKASGRPSGQAVVQILSQEKAQMVMQVLNGKYMGTRYIEIFPEVAAVGAGNAVAPVVAPAVTAPAPAVISVVPGATAATVHRSADEGLEHLLLSPTPATEAPRSPAADKGDPDECASSPMESYPWEQTPQWWGGALSPGGGLQLQAEIPGDPAAPPQADMLRERLGLLDGGCSTTWASLLGFTKTSACTNPPMLPSAAELRSLGVGSSSSYFERSALQVDAM